MRFQLLTLILASFVPFSAAQFPPPVSYTTVIKSPINPNISISYKSPDPGTCTTVFPTQKQYTGYISLPPYTPAPIQQDYSINTFFWFIEARQHPETAPLTIWLNGGPGSSSMVGLFQESGPCEVVPMADGSYGTQARMWGWDRSSNILYVDQPAQVGFSYDALVNASYDLLRDTSTTPPKPVPAGQLPYSFLNGTFSSGNRYDTANTTQIAAHAVWHFLQGFLATFPQYNPGTRPNSTSTSPAGINLFAESYGGTYGPVFASLFQQQNAARATGLIPFNKTLEIRLASLGIINGLVDVAVQTPFWPKFANNNTYGIQALDTTGYINGLSDFNAVGGCRDLISQCRNVASGLDPQGEGDVTTVNDLCASAQTACDATLGLYSSSGRDFYDIRQNRPSPFPSRAYQEYLNTASVQSAIGAPLNFTESNPLVFDSFHSTGDEIRNALLPSLATLINLNVRVAFIYGDADYICNWLGGEAVSLALASLLPAPYATAFPRAGYAPIVVNSSYVGGAVRQFGNLSFARIYDAGHLVPAYQPETAFTVFTRVITGADVSTGEPVNLSSFGTTGPQNATHANKAPSPSAAAPTCWLRAINDTCTPQQAQMVQQGRGVVIQGVLYDQPDDYKPPATSNRAGVPGTLPAGGASSGGAGTSSAGSAVSAATGVYVATATPSQKGGAGVVDVGWLGWVVGGWSLMAVFIWW